MKKSILLIRTNSTIQSTPPPLGLMYIASYLRSQIAGVSIKIIDARIKDLSLSRLKQEIYNFNPYVIGITSLHADSLQLHQIAKFSKGLLEKCIIIAGGPYATSDYSRALANENIDFCVVGEGEVTFTEFMLALEAGFDMNKIHGLAFRNNGHIGCGGERQPIENLDRIPFPAWDLINLDDYFYGKKRCLENPMQIHKRAVPLLSSRGCPFGCIYCHNIFGKKFRSRSPENIIDEIKLLIREYKIQEIEFLDDAFNTDVQRAKSICESIVNNNIDLRICFSNGLRADLMDKELLGKLKQAGTYRINYGIESVSPQIQNITKKMLNVNAAMQVIEETVKQRILCGGFFMFGFPTETEYQMLQTVDFACKSKLHTAAFALVTPYPKTELYAMAKKKGYNVDVPFSTVTKVSINMSAVSNKRLEEIRRLAYRRFYFDIERIWRIFKLAPNKKHLFKNLLEVFWTVFFKKELFA